MDCALLPASVLDTLGTYAMFAAWLPAIILMVVFHSRFIELSRQQWPDTGRDNYFKLAGILVTLGAIVVYYLVVWMLVPVLLDWFCVLKIG